MRLIQLTWILLMLVGLNACQHTGKETQSPSIQINLESEQVQDSLAFSLFADSMTSIPLETTDDCLLGSIRDVIIEDTLIIVLPRTRDAVYFFNRQGKYLRKIARLGNGPGEYSFVIQMYYNKGRKSLSLVGPKVMEFDLYGNLKNEFNLGYYAMNSVYQETNGNYILSRLGSTDLSECVIQVDSTGKKIQTLYTRNPDYKIRSSLEQELLKVGNEVHFISPQIENKIYAWNQDTLRLAYDFDICPKISKDHYTQKPNDWGLKDDYLRTIYQESEKWILLCYWSEVKGTRFLVYNKETDKYFLGKKLWNDIDGTESPYFLSTSSGNTFTNYRKSTNIEDNPVIQILHLKN